jgi:hypothetical protein
MGLNTYATTLGNADAAVAAISTPTYAVSGTAYDAVKSIVKAELPKKPDVDPEVKSTINLIGNKLFAYLYKDGFKTSQKELIPDIKDVTIHQNHVVIVEFVDGTTEKAVLHPDDKFSIEQGISICITKRLIGGSAVYNKLIDRAMKIMKKNRLAEAKEKQEKEIRKERAKKYAAKKAARRAAKREEYIATIAEAIARGIAASVSNAEYDDIEK